TKSWVETAFPISIVETEPTLQSQNAKEFERRSVSPLPLPVGRGEGRGEGFEVRGLRFGIIRPNRVSALVHNSSVSNAWTFDGQQWLEDKALLSGLELDGKPIFTAIRKSDGEIIDRGLRLRDLDGDERCELII